MSRFERSVAVLCGAAMAGIRPAALAVCDACERSEFENCREVFPKKGIRFEVLATNGEKITYLVFREAKLREQLALAENAEFLAQFGYPAGNFEGCLRYLKLRLRGDAFPHEVGVFLGYALEDVCGYMRDPAACLYCGAWKVYAEPEKNFVCTVQTMRRRNCTPPCVRRDSYTDLPVKRNHSGLIMLILL